MVLCGALGLPGVATPSAARACAPRTTAPFGAPARRGAPARHSPARAAAEEESTALTGEWPVNWSLASYEDVGEFFQQQLFKESASPGTTLQDVMSTALTTATPDMRKDDVKSLFSEVSGMPVVKSSTDKTLIGVLSKKDLDKPGSYVKDLMSSPPIAARPDNKVADAACLMLKHKVHRIPVVDKSAKVVGIVTRTDIFTALASMT